MSVVANLLAPVPWAVDPSWFTSAATAADFYSAKPQETWPGLREPLALFDLGDGFAQLDIQGPILHNPNVIERIIFGAVSFGDIRAAVSEAGARPDVRGVLLNFNSPGGMVTGTPETAAVVRSLAERKPVVAFTDGLMASAAYWLGAQASSIVASRSARVGSIGVVVPHRDFSKAFSNAGVTVDVITNDGAIYKGAGITGTSLTPEQRADIVGQLNTSFAMFKADITANRRIGAEAMRGQVFYAEGAEKAGLVDVVGGYAVALHRLGMLADRKDGTGAAGSTRAGPAHGSVSPAVEYKRLLAEGKNREAGAFYIAHRAEILGTV